MKRKKFNIFNISFFYSIKIKLVNLKFILEMIKRLIGRYLRPFINTRHFRSN